MKKIQLLFLLIFYSFVFNIEACGLLIFSYNRPLQLYALLESIERHVTGLTHISVLVRIESSRFMNSYKEVFDRFPYVVPLVQNVSNSSDFRNKVLHFLSSFDDNYVAFAVDDLIVKDSVDIAECVKALITQNAHAFFLRLGKNITCSYPKRLFSQPKFTIIENEFLMWEFKDGSGNWRYPHNLDFTIYSKSLVKRDFDELRFKAPNSLEGNWHHKTTPKRLGFKGLCSIKSKVVNIPMTQVQNETTVPWMGVYTANQLQDHFEKNLKINIDDLYRVNNVAPHMDFLPNFILRN